MKLLPASRSAELCCDAALVCVILAIGCTTASIWHSLTVPHTGFRMDIVDEVHSMALVLNLELPVALVTLAASTAIKISKKSFHLLSFLFACAGALGVSACALAMYSCFVAAHPGVNLWSRIWWRFTT